MRYLALLIPMIVMLGGCKSNSVPASSSEASRQVQVPTQGPEVSADVPVEFLLSSTAGDFHKQNASTAMRFRHIRIAYDPTPDGKKIYMMCGQFRPAQKKDESDWTPFVTIKTSGYELYIGDTNYCQRPSLKWEEGDLSSALQSRFDSTQ
jgi:hypothetical protein